LTQGGSCLATLGFGTESRWNSQTGALRRSGHDAVRANLDLPDFFENLAGDHGEMMKEECGMKKLDLVLCGKYFFILPS
jgi:hypothetical protein